jgi:Heterokaryon incompatibility protein (HET)
MRLLKRGAGGEWELAEFLGDGIPEYAILSHTWGAAGSEVTFQDLINHSGRDKTGYAKIEFCGNQAARDGLQYFWVDTCCTIQTHHQRQSPTKRVAYAAENGGRTCIAFQYTRINISLPSAPLMQRGP